MIVTPVILCGGFGTCLWPLSRAGFAKQFLVLSGVNTIVGEVNRLAHQAAVPTFFVSEKPD